MKSILLVLFAPGTLERLLLAGETPMARQNSESNYTDCKGSRCTVEQVEKIRKIFVREVKRGNSEFDL